MLQRELWAARRSTTAAWHTCFTLSCIGSMWQIESNTSLGWRCTSACMARHRIICLSCVHRSLKLLNDSIFVPPTAIYSLFHGFSSIRTALAPSLSLDQRHGTCSKTICVSRTRTCKLTVFVVQWRRVFLISTRHIECIRGAFCDDALYKLTFTLLKTNDMGWCITWCAVYSPAVAASHCAYAWIVLLLLCWLLLDLSLLQDFWLRNNDWEVPLLVMIVRCGLCF